MPQKTTTTRGLLVAALKKLTPKGAWIRQCLKDVRNGRPCYCVNGALLDAAGAVGRQSIPACSAKAYYNAVARLEKLAGVAGQMVTAFACVNPLEQWNDAPGRTQAEVVALVRKASRV